MGNLQMIKLWHYVNETKCSIVDCPVCNFTFLDLTKRLFFW
jgi:hypothetical protein